MALKIGLFPVTNKIVIGQVRDGLWARGRVDVTREAVSVVAAHLLTAEGALEFEVDGEKFIIKVEKVVK